MKGTFLPLSKQRDCLRAVSAARAVLVMLGDWFAVQLLDDQQERA